VACLKRLQPIVKENFGFKVDHQPDGGSTAEFCSTGYYFIKRSGALGILGGHANAHDAEEAWKAVMENVNLMATNLTNQVRSIATVTTAVAHGDLSKKIDDHAQGEILQFKNTINKRLFAVVCIRSVKGRS